MSDSRLTEDLISGRQIARSSAFLLNGGRNTPDSTAESRFAHSAQAMVERVLLEHQDALMRTMLEHIPVMIAVLDSENNVLYINKEYECVMGWTEEEVRGLDIVSACLPDPAEQKEAKEFLRRAEARWAEFRTTNKHGVLVPCMWMNLRVGDLLFGIGIDVSERERRVAEEQRAREALEARVERHTPAANRYGLTFRELTVLTLVADGKTDREIAALLSIGLRTVQTHISNILTKLGAKVRTEAGVRAVREGIID